MEKEIYIFLMIFFSLFFSCLMLGKAHWILFWPPDICDIKVGTVRIKSVLSMCNHVVYYYVIRR
jgi:hypothetical protein